MTISEAFSRDCRGLVFEPPCPNTYVSDNVIVGNLIVQADATFGGGALNVTGTGMVDEEVVNFELGLNATHFVAHSGDKIELKAGNKSYFNSVGGSVSIESGSGVAKEGGSGGDLSLSAGSGYGEEQFGGNVGTGGDVIVTAGGTSGGAVAGETGGQVIMSAGTSASQTGGRVFIQSGVSTAQSSGALGIVTTVSGTNGVSGFMVLST